MVEYFGALSRSMDRATILAQLARAEGYVIDGERQSTRQRKIVAQFEDAGADRCAAAKTARELLYSVELAQRGHIAHRDRLRSLVDQTDAERTINLVRYSANRVDCLNSI
jgi:hypothetical protein